MQKIKKEKGITMVALTVTIVVMLCVITPISVNLIQLSKTNNLSKIKSDFEIIKEAISVVSNDNSLEIGPVFSGNVNLGDQKNPNDGDIYYVINMDLLNTLYRSVSGINIDSLYNGRNNYGIGLSVSSYQNNDIFIMNKDTHTVYYLSKQNGSGYYIGYEYEGSVYYRFF